MRSSCARSSARWKMSVNKARIDTIRVVLAGTPIANDQDYPSILGELNEVVSANKVSKKNRMWLLQVLHSTRALDSALAAFVRQKPINLLPGQTPDSLGKYLYLLANHTTNGPGKLPQASRVRFQNSIVDHRNTYMHRAGAFPANERDILRLLAEMHACLTQVTVL